MDKIYTVLRTKNDVNGNPRHVAVVQKLVNENHGINYDIQYAERLAVIEIGYRSPVQAVSEAGFENAICVGQYNISPSEYRVWEKMSK